MRIEKDSLGSVRVEDHALWGAQTQRSLENFPRESELMPQGIIRALVLIKKACAMVNFSKGRLDSKRKDLIIGACDEILTGNYDDQFPLTVWQTGSGTQTNMNVNEVISHLANSREGSRLIHPNDHVNMSQSSNDTFPTAIHISTLMDLEDKLYPAIATMLDTLKKLEKANKDLIKTGRTHLQDATPLRLSDEISGWREMVARDHMMIKRAAESLLNLAIGGTAVGTGINAPEGFGKEVATVLKELTETSFSSDFNKFYQLQSKGAILGVHGAIKTLATDLYKIGSDIRFLSSGPRCGIGELIIPANEPGSSIMPGKINPTQVESLTMVIVQVMANDSAISMANTQGQLELNVYMPLIAYNMDRSIDLLSKSITCFTNNLLKGLRANEKVIRENLDKTLMLVTKLSPVIGYEKAARIAKYAYENDLSLREAALNLGLLNGEEYDRLMVLEDMI